MDLGVDTAGISSVSVLAGARKVVVNTMSIHTESTTHPTIPAGALFRRQIRFGAHRITSP